MQKNLQSFPEIFILSDKYVLLDQVMDLPRDRKVELDLGCGKGDFSIQAAGAYPDRFFLAADIMLGRLRKVQSKAKRAGLDNLALLRVEARHLIGLIMSDCSLDRIHLLCPDPWPKNRHRGHRLLSSDFMMQLARVLKPGGTFHFATDDMPYLELAMKNVTESGLFGEASDGAPADVAEFRTEFENRWLAEGKSVTHKVWSVLK